MSRAAKRAREDEEYTREAKKRKIEARSLSDADEEYLEKITEQLWREIIEMKANMDRLQLNLETNGQNLIDTLKKRSEEYENSLKDESKKLDKIYEEINNYRASRQKSRDAFVKFEEEKEKLSTLVKESRENEKALMAAIGENIKEADEYIKITKRVYDNTKDMVKIFVSRKDQD
ncbi:uncharacterized protein LOC115676599 [Syzygium oleosum]|uniref:uncharacterized protein LOC115676599 n=1 Tax=Syzygium oleosum TaxID=219896 RepID=UPI0024BB915E|nr:uncharacterized protein LOC115676599 [Syzygium oleosum]